MNPLSMLGQPLGQLMESRRWTRYDLPFAHIQADSVLRPDSYNLLAQEFESLLNLPNSFSKPYQHYDSLVARLPSAADSALRFFARADWWEMLANTLSVRVSTLDVSVELHHHRPESRSGTIHNDLNPAWFVGEAHTAECNLADPQRCSYRTGRCADTTLKPRRMVRAVAMIYYLNNAPWRPHHGGETALFPAFTSADVPSAHRIPPNNNSMVVFRCSPFSFHKFVTNHRTTRSSIVGWLHEPYEDAVNRWGSKAIVHWPEENN